MMEKAFEKFVWLAELEEKEKKEKEKREGRANAGGPPKSLHAQLHHNTAGITYLRPPPAPPRTGIGYAYKIDSHPRLGHAWKILRVRFELYIRGKRVVQRTWQHEYSWISPSKDIAVMRRVLYSIPLTALPYVAVGLLTAISHWVEPYLGTQIQWLDAKTASLGNPKIVVQLLVLVEAIAHHVLLQ